MSKILSTKLFHFCWQVIILFSIAHLTSVAQINQPDKDFLTSENAYRANNTGVGLLEQFKSEEAEKEFRQALALKPNFDLAEINLAIALFNSKKLDEATTLAREYLETHRDSVRAYYILGLIARSANEMDESLGAFRKVLEIDPNDVGANVNAGQISAQKREYPAAIKYFQTAYEAEPYNLTAIYNLATTLQRTGEPETAAELLKKFQVLRDTSAGTTLGLNYLEQGRYAEAVSSTGAEGELVDLKTPRVKFTDATSEFFQNTESSAKENIESKTEKPRKTSAHTDSKFDLTAQTATLFDYDNDGLSDLVISRGGTLSLYHNEKGKFVDVTKKAGDLAKDYEYISNSVIAGDYNNDLKPDLLAIRADGFTLYRNDGDGKFTDATKTAGLPVHKSGDKTPITFFSSAWVDYDHDGDLDIFAPGGSDLENQSQTPLLPNRLFRNNGDGTFTDVSKAANVADKLDARAVVPTDFNNTRDVDLLVVGTQKTALYSNQRNDSFRDVAQEVGLEAGGKCVAAADVNKDGSIDFFIGRDDGESTLYLSDGRGKFTGKKIVTEKPSPTDAQFLDYDNDGLIDLVTSDSRGLHIWRNLGDKWKKIEADKMEVGGSFVSGDLDKDGDLDIVFIPLKGSLKILRNDGGNANNSIDLQLQGRVSNKTGIGAKVVLRAGSLSQQLETYSASPMPAPSEVHFGLGKREGADAVRVLWSSGIVQSETDFAENQTAKKFDILKIQELDRKPASCPYLYTWDGEKFVFITDFLGGGEMANWASRGVYHYPDSDEYVRIAPNKLKAKDGFYEIRVANELEEVMYLDKVKLIAVEHDADAEVYPNEGLGKSETSKNIFYETRNLHAPLSAKNSAGQDITPKIRDLDNIFYDDFKSLPLRGYAETHYLTLDLDDIRDFKGRTLLLLTGWTDYAFSSDNLAASQSGKSLSLPQLQVRNKKGEWQTVIESIGISVGRPQTVPVDLTGKFLSDSREVRIVTNFETFWDKIAVDTVDTSEQIENFPTFEIEPERADLRERGFSAENKFGGMIVPDYSKVSLASPWKNFAGKLTRTGDVKPLLRDVDDIFAIAKAGDEFVLSFKELPAPPAGKNYTFLLYADGYSKEMDINSGSPDAVLPLPFKKMSNYPYGADERFPMTEEKRRIYEEYTTRYSRGGLAEF